MEFKRPTPTQVQLGLRALKTVALSKSTAISDRERKMISGVQHIFETQHNFERLETISPEELAEQISDPIIREQIVHALIVLCLIDGEAQAAEITHIEAFATALGVHERSIHNLQQLAKDQLIRLRIDVLRRFWAIDKLRERVDSEGLMAVLKFVRANVGRLEDASLAERFETLRNLPEGSLGNEYIRYLERNKWPLPGERGALSDIIVYHDMTHVLSGYDTTPLGEIQVACFSAGYRKKDPFTFVIFVLLQFHLGVRVTPGAPAETGFFDVELALRALQRGAAMNIDLSAEWDYWGVVDQPVDELRNKYGIPDA